MRIAEKIAGALASKANEASAAVEAVQNAQALVDRLAGEVAAAADRVAALENQTADAAVEAVANAEGEAKYAELTTELTAAKAKLARAEAAHTGATRKLDAARREQIKASNAEYVRTVKRLGDARAKAAQGIEAAVAQLASHWQALHATNLKLTLSYPGGILPLGACSAPGDVARAVEAELFRQSGKDTIEDGLPALPGAHVSPMVAGTREKIPSITATIAGANEFLVRSLTGDVDTAELFSPIGGAS